MATHVCETEKKPYETIEILYSLIKQRIRHITYGKNLQVPVGAISTVEI